VEAAIQKKQGLSSYDWMAGSSPAMTVERKFANVFMASSASGNTRVIKFAFDGIKSGLSFLVLSCVLIGKPLHAFPDAL
jgi:hypothetical protein